MANTEHLGLSKPDPSANVDEEFIRLQQTLDQLDAIIYALQQVAAGKAAADHNHQIAAIQGLAEALAAKMNADRTFSLDDLSDVDGATAAAVNYVLVKSALGPWVPSSAIAALGVHGHSIAQVAELQQALDARPTSVAVAAWLAEKLDKTGGNIGNAAAQAAFRAAIGLDPWVLQPIGVPIPLEDHLPGVLAPPTDKDYRYIKLTASDAYNVGFLTGETITGSAPLVVATATVTLAGFPMNGQVVSLINTERRVLRAGSAGSVQNDAFQGHRHGVPIGTEAFIAAAAGGGGGSGGSTGWTGGYSTGDPQSDGSSGFPRTAIETRMKNIGVTYFMRIK
jgi:hypothetical protein